ncbi:WD domain-containing protein, G-beta repeat-containing protein [Myxococcus fulvus]|uniref:WD domain-containing protein, G-beta repeat-containing protein n=1 Tax=Myxococcus fulvus TaxID=33 RepID=A0ABY1CKZ4_MYXFU|nr:WD domain-containing protein, G-beta repeat-containing protein [Myxococcus fulvus]
MTPRIVTPENAKQLTRLRQLGEPTLHPDYWGQVLTFDPRSRLLVSMVLGSKGRLRWWDLQDELPHPRVVQPLPGGLEAVVLPDAQTIMSVTVGGQLQAWSAADGRALRSAHLGLTTSGIDLSRQGDLLLVAGVSGDLRLWDVAHWRPLRDLEPASALLYGCALSADATLAAAGAADDRGENETQGSIRIWDVATGASRGVISVQASRVWDVAFTPSGNLLAAGTSVDDIILVDVVSMKVVGTLKGPPAGAWRLSFNSDGSLLAIGADTGAFVVLRTDGGGCVHAYSDKDDQQASAAVFSPDGRFVAWGEDLAQVGVWGVDA